VKFGRKPILTPHQQREARERLASGEPQRSVARSYNASQATISRLVGKDLTDGIEGWTLRANCGRSVMVQTGPT
jgi:hypothetical protein